MDQIISQNDCWTLTAVCPGWKFLYTHVSVVTSCS